nr:hypothetical protein [Tanacetum cinerariifolium]GEW97407.1 hypothetical protein [Tanacetum cinerariifolium]
MEALQDDDSGMICTEHPFKNTTPAGGICAFCLQEKLGKLVSSSFPITVFPSSSSSSPSFRSDTTTNVSTTITTVAAPNPTNPSSNDCHYINQQHPNKSRILYLLTQKKKKKSHDHINLKRSKSTATPLRRHAPGHAPHYMEGEEGLSGSNKRGFWSFLYMQKHAKRGISSNMLSGSQRSKENEMIIVEENDSPRQPSFDRKVSRSRSVGCGSRSFSGDFFERISTGFGDCTLRRVESNREGKKGHNLRAVGHDGACMKERVRCGGLFSGFMITSSSSSSSSSSYWVASNPNDVIGGNVNGKMTSACMGMTSAHGRSKSWGWALASPMRAFSKTTTKKEGSNNNNKNQTPNLSAIPSLLSVRS